MAKLRVKVHHKDDPSQVKRVLWRTVDIELCMFSKACVFPKALECLHKAGVAHQKITIS